MKRAATEPMLPNLMILMVPLASRLKRVTVLRLSLTPSPSVSTGTLYWPNSSTTRPRMEMIGSSVKPRPCSSMPPPISMKKTLPAALPVALRIGSTSW